MECDYSAWQFTIDDLTRSVCEDSPCALVRPITDEEWSDPVLGLLKLKKIDERFEEPLPSYVSLPGGTEKELRKKLKAAGLKFTGYEAEKPYVVKRRCDDTITAAQLDDKRGELMWTVLCCMQTLTPEEFECRFEVLHPVTVEP